MRRLALILLLSCTATAQVRPVQDGVLSLIVIPAKQVLQPNDTLLMKVEVTNIGDNVVVFRADDLCLNPGAGLSLTITDASGHTLKSTVPMSCVPSPDISERDGLIHLQPDAFYGKLIRIEPTRISPKPGRYELTFTLRATLSRQQFTRMLNAAKTPAVAFSSESSPLVFKFPIEISK